jgi:antitoxin PrlF
MMPVSTLTTKYQATIPRQVREVLQVGAGDRIEFLLEEHGSVRLRKAPAHDEELQALEATLAPEWESAADDDAYAGL